MASLEHLDSFVQNYKFPFKKNPPNLNQFNTFLRNFRKNRGKALEYLSELEGDNDDLPKAKGLMHDLSAIDPNTGKKKFSWNSTISEFKIKINWYGSDDLDPDFYEEIYPTLPVLIDDIATKIQALPIDAPQRELFAILLANLLPFYFLRAANITEMVYYLKEK
ncbi:MAG: hypothetical protein F6K24_14465, partial [Okeania sp. SIO2D1]|nr:hypothetical protein [Okeania sp. SIO2D1]